MKEVFVPENFNLVDIVNKLQGKIKIKQFLKRRYPECIGIIFGTSISALFCNGLNFTGILCFGTFSGILVLSERYRNREIAKKNLINSMDAEIYDEVLEKLEVEDFTNAIIYSKKPKNDHWW